MRPIVAAAPYLTVGLLLLLFHFVGGTLTASKGLLFDLPADGTAGDGVQTDLVAMVMPMRHETVVFFDDSRYLLSEPSSLSSLGEHLSERTRRDKSTTLLVLADRRVSGGELMSLASLARKSGVLQVLFAERGATSE